MLLRNVVVVRNLTISMDGVTNPFLIVGGSLTARPHCPKILCRIPSREIVPNHDSRRPSTRKSIQVLSFGNAASNLWGFGEKGFIGLRT